MLTKKKEKPDRREYLTKTPVPKLITQLSIPTIISMLVTGIYNSADTYFVGKISTEATAAVGIVFSVMAMIQAMGFFCGHGSGNYLSRMLGSGNLKEAGEVASTGFALAILLGCIAAALGNLLAHPLAQLLGASPATMADTLSYMRIVLIGAPFMMGQFVINNQLRFQGSAMYAMVGLMSGAVVNIILDPLLILYFGLGTVGAAIATVSGQIVSFFVLLAGSMQGENIRLTIRNVHFSMHLLYEIVNGGAPSLFRQGLAAVATLVLNHTAGSMGGDAAIAGMSVTTRILMLMACVMIGFGQGFQPVCSYNYGAGLKSRVKEGYFFCAKYGFVFLTVLATVCFIFAPSVVGWFRNDPLVIATGSIALRAQCITLPLLSVTTMTNMMLQSTGKGVKASILASARNGIFFLPAILILPHLFGLFGVQIAQAVADVLSVALAIPLAASELRLMEDTADGI
ncbi:MAG: MATE family efflux transporter [Lachnospiraceae bacterium]|nr:MATE family efflux transporter [Lachnospiraceae bacterium]